MADTTLFHKHELSQFLSNRRAQDASTATMTAMGPSGGKWTISDDDYPKFFDLLHDYLFVKHGLCMNLVERPKKNEPKPLLIDLDFRYPDDTSLTRRFNSDNVEQFTHLIVEGVKLFFGLEAYNELRFFTTLRPAPYDDKGKRKDGVHIFCPDIALASEKQSVLRKWILSQEGIKRAFKDTDYTNSDEDVYDESMTKPHQQGWIFYGESKPKIQPYKLEYVFKYIPDEDSWIDEDPANYSARDLMELLSVRYAIVPDQNILKESATGLYANLLHKPFKSEKPEPQVNTVQETEGQKNPIMEAISLIYTAAPPSEQERTMIRRFVMDCLGPSWYEQYDKWIRVGWCLHNIEANEDMFNLWMEFSAKSGKSSGNNIAQLKQDWFYGMRKTDDGPRLTERSLRKWARDDNLAVYNEIISNNIHDYIREEVEPTHYHVAMLMKKMYGPNYIASVNQKSTEWYNYDESINMWKRLNQGVDLKLKISDDVAREISLAVRKLQSRLSEAGKEASEFIQKKIQNMLKVQIQLYNNGFTDSVMKMAIGRFREDNFGDKLNMNPLLFGCRNGVLELRAKVDDRESVIFRQGRPEDFVSFLAGQNHPVLEPINYIPYNATDPVQEEIADFLAKIFPNKELRAYVLRLFASCLEGNNIEQCYYTFIGVGSNGKSKIIDLMKYTLGDYQTSMQSTVLTRKRPDSSGANPDIMAIKCRRLIYMQEPDEKEPINTSRMKQFSGEDVIEARELYGDQQKFRCMGKMIMLCNTLPPISSMDQGTWRRIRVVPFESRFLDDDHADYINRKPNDNIFLKDITLDAKLMKWREGFLSLLVHIYKTEYIPKGLKPVPEMVMQASNKYKESFDVYARFKAERIREPVTAEEQLECRTNPITTGSIKSTYMAWKKENHVTTLSGDEMIKSLTNNYGVPEKGKNWPMIMVFTSDDDIATWDKEHIKC